MLTLPFSFTPLKDFASGDFKSFYTTGMNYTVRPGNGKLAAAVEKWLQEGKVAEAAINARITGKE